MKKIALLFLTVIMAIGLSGCNNQIEKAREDANNIVNDAKETAIDTKESIENATNKVKETVDDTKAAAKEVKEAKEAIDEISN